MNFVFGFRVLGCFGFRLGQVVDLESPYTLLRLMI